jgi:hypothetical protein
MNRVCVSSSLARNHVAISTKIARYFGLSAPLWAIAAQSHAQVIAIIIEYTDSFSPPERLQKTPDTIGLYDFTIDTGRFAIDRSGHGNHGIIRGAKYVNSADEPSK